jgi:hypothetical protein
MPAASRRATASIARHCFINNYIFVESCHEIAGGGVAGRIDCGASAGAILASIAYRLSPIAYRLSPSLPALVAFFFLGFSLPRAWNF